MKQLCDWMWWGPLTNQKPPRAIDQSQLLCAPEGCGGPWRGQRGPQRGHRGVQRGVQRGMDGVQKGAEGTQRGARGHRGAQIGVQRGMEGVQRGAEEHRGVHRGCRGGIEGHGGCRGRTEGAWRGMEGVQRGHEGVHGGVQRRLFVLGYHWLPLETIDLVGDNRELECLRHILGSSTYYEWLIISEH